MQTFERNELIFIEIKFTNAKKTNFGRWVGIDTNKKFVQTSKHLELPEKERKRRVRFYEQVAKKVYRGIE